MPTVTDLKTLKRPRNHIEVWLDGESWRRLLADTVVLFNLRRDQSLTPERLEEIRLSDDALQARQLLARYTALTLRSARQCHEYLRRRGFDEAIADGAVKHGREYGWIDDERFAAAYVREKNKLRPTGPAKLRAELMSKGIAPAEAEAALDRHGPDLDDQRANARAAATKRLKAWGARYEGNELRGKLYNTLARQGYEADLVRQVVDEMMAQADSPGDPSDE